MKGKQAKHHYYTQHYITQGKTIFSITDKNNESVLTVEINEKRLRDALMTYIAVLEEPKNKDFIYHSRLKKEKEFITYLLGYLPKEEIG